MLLSSVVRRVIPSLSAIFLGALVIIVLNLFSPSAQSACGNHMSFPSAHKQLLETLTDSNCNTFFIMPPQENLSTASSVIANSGSENNVNTVNAFQLHSRPDSQNILYLDFDGITWQAESWWLGAFGISAGMTSPGFDLNGNPLTFTDAEKSVIAQVWANVAEDFAVFDVDVTTERPTGAREALFNQKGAYALILTDSAVQTDCGCGGVAHVDTFDSGNTFLHPALNFSKFGDYYAQGYDVAEIISHEVGHNMGLAHDGQVLGTNNDWRDEYYTGHGAWTPIMGAGRGRGISHWSYGGYPLARTTFNQYSEDDFETMARHIPIIQDEAGNSIDTATEISTDLIKNVFQGLITTQIDVDVYKVTVGSAQTGTWKFSANAAPFSPNLDIDLKIYKDSGSNLIATNNPQTPTQPVYGLLNTGMSAEVSISLTAGTYYVRIDGVGQGSLMATGYDDYGSVGSYSLVIEAPRVANSEPTLNYPLTTTSGQRAAAVNIQGTNFVTGSTTITFSGSSPVSASVSSSTSLSVLVPITAVTGPLVVTTPAGSDTSDDSFTVNLVSQSSLNISNVTRTTAANRSITLTTSGGSGSGSVTYGKTGTGCSLSGATLSVTQPTTCTLVATKAASGIYASASSASVDFIFTAVAQTTLKISNTIKRAGAGTTFALTTSGGLGDGLISFAATGTGCSTSSANLTSTQVGTCSVVATKAAQGIYSAISSSPLVFTFTAATQSALVISNATLTNIASTPVTLTTTGGSGEGAITYKASGSGCAISTTTLTATRPTTCSVTATKAAHGIYKAASSAVVRFIFTLAPQESLSISNSPTSANAGTPIALTTTGGSGAGAVKFTLTPSAGCRLSGTTLNTTAPATCTLTATKAANGVYAAATSAPVTFTFSAVPQSTLTISNAITSAQKGKKITLTTTGGSGTGKVTYTLISGSCTISGSTLTSTTATTCSISATKAAAGIYSAGSSGAKEFTFTN
jgi:hypothetical protein